jgi:tetratricopeptide (TPR) repeat protein
MAGTTTFSTRSLATALRHALRLLQTKPELAETQAREILLVHPLHPAAQTILAEARAAQALPHAWRELGDFRRKAGDKKGADAAYANHISAATGDPQLLEAGRALAENRLAFAERMLRQYLKLYPTDIAAIRMLAETGSRLGRYEDAEKLLARCLEIAPRFTMARQNYATVLYRQNKAAEAIAQADILLADEPSNPGFRALKAAALGQIGEYGKAVAIYQLLLNDCPNEPKAWMSYGHSLRALGRQKDCVAAYRRSVALSPGLGEAWWSLANIKTYRLTTEDIAEMEKQLTRSELSDEDRWHLHFALGKAFEDGRFWSPSFEHYRDGNKLRRKAIDYDASETTAHAVRSQAFFTRAFFAERSAWGLPARDPIFIVGLPRAGSTLIEQILASHSAVEGTMELPDIASMARRLGGKMKRSDRSSYPEILAGLDAAELKSLGEEYLARTNIHRRLGRSRFIDKMPNNFAHMGLIRLMLPNAKIIDARRHPLACCFSLFKQHFARGQGFSYDLTEIGGYYLDYDSLMTHFDSVLSGRIYRVFYEQMVAEPEREIRRLLDYCELPYEHSCLRFYENERPVRSASSEQVRQPLFHESLDQWRYYEEWLAPLKAVLAPVLATYPGQPVSGG